MNDLFEREEQALTRARTFLASEQIDMTLEVREEFDNLTENYVQTLRQLRWVTRIADLTALGLNTDKIALLNKVNIDALTEIYNRRFLTVNLERYLKLLGISGDWITIMMLDVDFFKNYNDTYGHPAGDICLKKIANALRYSLSGAEDFVVRYGGEEFIAVLPGSKKEVGLIVAQRILETIRRLRIPHATSEIGDYVTISIGMISTVPEIGSNMQAYIDRVDTALYQSKRNGRNQSTYLEFEKENV